MRILKAVLLSRGSMSPHCLWHLELREVEEVKPEALNLRELVADGTPSEDWAEWPVRALTSTRRLDRQHAKEAIRCPGVITVAPTVNPQIQKVNEAKAAFKRLIDSIPERDRRYLYREVPKFHAVQALRLIYLFEHVDEVRFRWFLGDSVSRDSCRAFIDSLEEKKKAAIDAANSQQDKERIQFLYNKDIEKLKSVNPDEVLAKVRPVQPHFRSYLVPQSQRLNCPTPILINNRNIKVEATFSLPGAADESSLTGLFESEPLVEHMCLYRYKQPKLIHEVTFQGNTSRMRGGNYLEVK